MKTPILLSSLLGAATTASASASRFRLDNLRDVEMKQQSHRALSGSEDTYDDDFWAYNVEGTYDTVWSDYNLVPKKCMIQSKTHVIAYEMYGKGNKSCSRKKQGTYIMDVGRFAKAYVAQKRVDYQLMGKDYDNPDALGYLECTAQQYNDNYYYVKLGCSNSGGLKLLTYTDANCSSEVNVNTGLYNDIKISFNTCTSCVTWPAQTDDANAAAGDDAAAADDQYADDDNFEYTHQYDSKLCSAADNYASSCGWGCKRQANKGGSSSSSSSSYSSNSKKYWSGVDKFFLFFWSVGAVGLVWVVLKQRRMMSREDAIVEEASMNGVGLKKRHIFPIALGIIFFTILSMFMVWKHLTWILLIGANAGLFAHFVFLRRKARNSANSGGYLKDGGLEIS